MDIQTDAVLTESAPPTEPNTPQTPSADDRLDNETLFAILQEELEPMVRRFVRRLISYQLGDDAVDDVMQEVMLALYQNLDKIEPISKAKAYTFGIARNLCYEELRRTTRRKSVALADEAPDMGDYTADRYGYEYAVVASDEASPDEATHWLMLNLEVQRAIDQLPEAHRQALILYCEEEMSYAEIAEIMNTNIGTVKSRLFYAKRALRGLLSPATLRAIEDS